MFRSRYCLHLAEECQFWILLGFDLPHPAAQFFNKWKKVKVLYEQVLTVAMDYNKIIAGNLNLIIIGDQKVFNSLFLPPALSDEERMLFRELIKKVDKKLSPGLSQIDWTNEFSEDYITDVSALTGEVSPFYMVLYTSYFLILHLSSYKTSLTITRIA